MNSEKLYIVPPALVLRAMGDDLVIVNEPGNKVVILNSSAVIILNGLLRRKTKEMIADDLKKNFVVETKETVGFPDEIERVRKELIDAGVLETQSPFEPPRVNVRDLKTALKELDLSRSTVSQYE